MKKVSANNLHWEPLPRRHFTPAQNLGICVRHLIPLVGVLVLGWSAGQFLLLSVFNVCFSIVSIGTLGVLVSTRQEVGPSPTLADAVGSWLTALLVTLLGTMALTVMFGWVIAVLVVNDGEPVFDRSLAISVLLMIVAAAPAFVRLYRDDLAAGLTEEQRKRRDQPNVLVLVLNVGFIFILSGYAGSFGRGGLIALVIAVTALLMIRDLRPDLARELARPSSMPAP